MTSAVPNVDLLLAFIRRWTLALSAVTICSSIFAIYLLQVISPGLPNTSLIQIFLLIIASSCITLPFAYTQWKLLRPYHTAAFVWSTTTCLGTTFLLLLLEDFLAFAIIVFVGMSIGQCLSLRPLAGYWWWLLMKIPAVIAAGISGYVGAAITQIIQVRLEPPTFRDNLSQTAIWSGLTVGLIVYILITSCGLAYVLRDRIRSQP